MYTAQGEEAIEGSSDDAPDFTTPPTTAPVTARGSIAATARSHGMDNPQNRFRQN